MDDTRRFGPVATSCTPKITARFGRGAARTRDGDGFSLAARNGGVWNSLGNWFFVTGGKPVFQRLQTPPLLKRVRGVWAGAL